MIFKKVIIPFIVFTIIFLFSSCTGNYEIKDEEITLPTVELDSFNFPVDSFKVQKIDVVRNKTMTDLLLPTNLEYQQILKIAKHSKEKFDVRKIKPGADFFYYTLIDSASTPSHLIYQEDALNYVHINLSDSFYIEKRKKDIKINERAVSAEIRLSLFNTLEEKNLDDNLALKLSEVFAWQIDFYRLYEGDKFIVYFEEEFVDDKFFRIGKILAAKFIHHGNEFAAFLFEKDGKQEYFDMDGKSLTKQFLKTPVKFGRISSNYSHKRLHPVLKVYRPHLGTDFAAPTGTPVRSIGDGIVEYSGRKGNNGIYIKVRHNSIYSSGYMHLSKIEKGIRRKKKVSQGQVIGYVGQTGLASGPHLDLRFWKNGKLINFLKAEFPSNRHIDSSDSSDFQSLRDFYLPKVSFTDEDITNPVLTE